jgi:hypothetical protein
MLPREERLSYNETVAGHPDRTRNVRLCLRNHGLPGIPNCSTPTPNIQEMARRDCSASPAAV